MISSSSTKRLDDDDVCSLCDRRLLPVIARYHGVADGDGDTLGWKVELLCQLFHVESLCLSFLVVDVYFHKAFSFCYNL